MFLNEPNQSTHFFFSIKTANKFWRCPLNIIYLYELDDLVFQAGDLLVSSDEEEEEMSSCLPSTSGASKPPETTAPPKAPEEPTSATKTQEGAIETMGVKLSGFNTDLTLKFLNGKFLRWI